MFHKDIDFLKQKEIGGVISKGLAEVYLKKPNRPVEYLAKWLLKFVNNERQKKE